ncbi:MAG: ATP-binding protein [Fibrobacterota bacterium]
MAAPSTALSPPGNPDVKLLLEAFRHFEENARRLESAYQKMQEDFRSVNIELDNKNKLLSQILQSLTNSVVAIDTRGLITSFNRDAARLTGVPVEEALGRPYADVLGRGQAEENTLLHTLRTGRHVLSREKNIVNAEGDPVPVSFTTALLEDSAGQRLGALEVFRDLSEVKHMQEEVQRAKTLAALGEMSAAVAHEIRNPLGAIGGFITLLERDLAGDAAKLELVKRIINSLASLNKIVSNLLVYTRPLALHPQEVPLQEHVGQVLDFIGISLDPARVTLTRAFPEEPVRIKIDPEKIEQVLINLVQNAVQAIPGTGAVTLSMAVYAAAAGERLFCNGLRVQKVVHLDIADTGKGIRSDDLGKIFNPFFTTRADGNGLGLSIVKKILELHNGEISVKSTPGAGTVFRLTFPA